MTNSITLANDFALHALCKLRVFAGVRALNVRLTS